MPDFDMPPRPASFEERGGWLVRRLAAEFSLTLEQAAGLVGNLGYESRGFEDLHEIGQPENVGGYGWAQWTGPRRRAFFAWCQAHDLRWPSDEANYGYLLEELRGAYHSSTIAALSRCATVDQAVWSVGQTYERPGGTTKDHLPGYEGRLHWAKRALAGAQAAMKPEPAPAPALDLTDPIALIRQAQRLLRTDPDGDPGPETRRLAQAWRDAHP